MSFRGFGLGIHRLYVKSCFRELTEMISWCNASMQSDFILFAFQSSDTDPCKRLQGWPHHLSWRYLMNAHGNSLPCLPRPTYQTTHHLRDKLTRSLGKDNGRGGCCPLNSLLVCVQAPLSEGRVFLRGQTWSTGDTFITPAPESLCNLAIFFSKLWRGFLKLFRFSIKMGHKNEVSICYQVMEVKVYRNIWKIKMTSHQEQLNTYCNLGRRRCL